MTSATVKSQSAYRLTAGFYDHPFPESLQDRNILGVAAYCPDWRPPAESPVPFSRAPLASYQDQPSFEIWSTNLPVTYELRDDLTCAYDGKTLFGSVQIPVPGDDLEKATREAYRQIFRHTEALGYPFLFRMWNFMSGINQPTTEGLERYRSFCKGRADAFFNDRGIQEDFLPAGTGIGAREGGLVIFFLASPHCNRLNLENPRQVPAYHYPVEYGPRSPSFARATWVDHEGEFQELYVSGTSSIIGHETVHQGDVLRQTQVTLENIETLLSHQHLEDKGLHVGATLEDLDLIKVYVRHPEDFETVKSYCATRFNPDAPIIYLAADICRSELLVEIEGRVCWDTPTE